MGSMIACGGFRSCERANVVIITTIANCKTILMVMTGGASAYLIRIAEGCADSMIEEVVGTLRTPLPPTANALKLEPLLLLTNTQFPSEVIPAENGLPLTDAVVDNALRPPVAGLKVNSETCEDFRSRTYTKSKAGSTTNPAGPEPAPTLPAGVSKPVGVTQLGEAAIHAPKILTVSDAKLDTSRKLSRFVPLTVRENARAEGFAPTG